MGISRRTFLESAALAGFASQAVASTVDEKTGMPMRVLGKTGTEVSLLGFGCGSRWMMYEEEDKAAEALNQAIEAGVTYIDTAQAYGDGESERRLGMFLGERRQKLWLATKSPLRKYDDVMRSFEQSLERLRTDHVDLFHMHDLRGADDLAAIEAPDGALKAYYKIRDEKTARYIGVTSHTDPETLATLLERHDLDCTQMALNAGLMGNTEPSNVRGYRMNFESVALPVALKKNMGVTAMKIMAQDKLLPDGRPENLIRYSMSLPVACAVIGMPKLEHVAANLKATKSFTPMPETERREFSRRLASANKASLDRFFLDHRDRCDECGVHLA